MATTERPRRGFGLRPRILAVCIGLLAVASLAAILLQRAVLFAELDREVDDALEQERREFERLVGGRDPADGQPFGDDVRAIFDTFLSRNIPSESEVFVTFVDGSPYLSTPSPVRLELVPSLAERWSGLSTGDRGEVATDAGPVRFVAVPLESGGEIRGVFVVANFLQHERGEIEHAFRVSVAVLVGVLFVASLVAWAVTGRLLRPLRSVVETASGISDADLTRRIEVTGRDEIAVLAHTINEMLSRLEVAFATQRAFVDDAGHELRTPITIVRGHLELMGDDPDERHGTVALVTDELDRMARIVDDLLTLAKAEQPDFVRCTPTEVDLLTTDLFARVQPLADRQWVCDATATGTVHLDAQRLVQAMLNLVRNAVEHTDPGDEIGIGARLADGELRVWVRDTGNGVDPSDRERIFGRFARASGSARRSEGAGLGLAIVTAVAAAHGGSVELESSPGQGSTFTIVLPDTRADTSTFAHRAMVGHPA